MIKTSKGKRAGHIISVQRDAGGVSKVGEFHTEVVGKTDGRFAVVCSDLEIAGTPREIREALREYAAWVHAEMADLDD